MLKINWFHFRPGKNEPWTWTPKTEIAKKNKRNIIARCHLTINLSWECLALQRCSTLHIWWVLMMLSPSHWFRYIVLFSIFALHSYADWVKVMSYTYNSMYRMCCVMRILYHVQLVLCCVDVKSRRAWHVRENPFFMLSCRVSLIIDSVRIAWGEMASHN